MRGDRISRLLLPVILCAVASAAEKVEVLRDEYGVPHIFARTAAGAAYGSGYAQAADRLDQLLSNLRGAGPRPPVSRLSPQVRTMLDAYCAGINTYLQESRRAGEKVDPAMVAAFSSSAYGQIPDSNHVLIAPARSRDKAVIAVLNPHGDWYGASRLYEMRVYAPEDGLAFAGIGPVGVPFPLMGHSNSVSIGVSGAGPAGDDVLDQVWSMITAKNLGEIRKALALGKLPRQRFFIGTAEGDIYDSASVTNPSEGVLLSGEGNPQAAAMMRELIGRSNTFSFESAVSLAFATDVWRADTWQKRIAKAVPESEFARVLTGWSRRAEPDSRPALAFYLFKMALAEEASALEPPDHVSDARIRAALRRAQDRLETEFLPDAAYGTLFRVGRNGAQRTFPVGGGTVPSAGMYTPRAIDFDARGSLMVGRGGQAAVVVVVLSRPPVSVALLPLGESDQAGSSHSDDQARELFAKSQTHRTYFGERKELEKHSKERKELVFP